MNPFDTPSPKERANHIKTEFSPSSPKIRLTLVAYLLENGVPEGYEVRELLDDLLDFVTADFERYAGLIDSITEDEISQGQQLDIDLDVDEDDGGSPYL